MHLASSRAFLAAVLSVALLGIACGPAERPQDATAPGQPAPDQDGQDDGGGERGTLELHHDKGPWEPWIDTMGERASQELGIALEQVTYPDAPSYQQVMQQALPASDAPDLITWWGGHRMADLVEEGLLEDVSDIWEQAVAAGDLPQSLQTAFTFDGHQYGVPFHVSYWPVIYNKRVFAEHDLQPPTTWEELRSLADTLVAADVTPFYATVDNRWPSFIWFEELLIRTDPDFYERLMEGEESYTDPVVKGVMQEWRSMIDAGYFTDLDLSMDTNLTSRFADGEVAMILLGTWFNAQIADEGLEPGEDYDAFFLPNVEPDLEENVAVFEAGPLLVPANAPDKESSRAFAEWWLGEDVQSEWATLKGDVPSNLKAQPDNAMLRGLVAEAEEGDYRLVQRYWEATPPEISEAAVDELARFMLNPGQADRVLQTIEQIARRHWDGQ